MGLMKNFKLPRELKLMSGMKYQEDKKQFELMSYE